MYFSKILIIASALSSLILCGTTGKISGQITDSKTNQVLVGVNVMLLGTSLGSATNSDGYYHILNVPPGFHDLKVSMIGYETKTITDLRVEIDLTAVMDISISTEAIEGDMQLVDCMDKGQLCELFDSCNQRSVWDHLQVNTLNFLENISLQDVTERKFNN